MNIFEVNRMLREREQEFSEAKKRWEETNSEEDKLSVAVKLLEMQILQGWIDKYKYELKTES